MRRDFYIGSLAVLLLLFGAGHLAVSQAPPEPLSDQEFQRLSVSLSERAGFFGTDNLVSNETSYLHVKSHLLGLARPGQAYLGVGPDQNFTYITQVRPSIAFILDIRRDNLLQHLYYKAIFLESRDRWDYLSLLFGKPLPSDRRHDREADAADLVRVFEQLPADRGFFEQNFERLWTLLVEGFPDLVSEEDRLKTLSVASAFFEDGLGVRYEIPGRPMLTFFPSFAQLMMETDLEGNRGHYLNSESDFQLLKEMQEANRIVPVTGNFAGPKALRAIGDEVRRRGLVVSVFYLSNVEFYLFRSRLYRRFIENARSLPLDGNSLFVRSYFNNWFGTWRTHPHAMLNYFSTSLCQYIQRFLELEEIRPYEHYWDLVTRDYLGAPTRPTVL